jgi:predicted enzyme related to lactoylglutathione lyase
MFKKLRTVIYHADDLQKAKEWYSLITGIRPYFEEVFYVGFDINGSELGLDPDMTNVKEGNNTVAYWAVDNIESAVNKIQSAGGTIVKDIADVGGGIKVAALKDPFGNTFGLIEEA